MDSVPTERDSSRRIQWRRLTAEGVAIVVSILLAFSIDAWWDSRRERVEEREHLTALASELTTARDVIRTEVDQIRSAAEAARRLLAMDVAQASSTDLDTLAALFARIFRVGRANLPSGALDALMASGDLRLIGDRDLATRLASWPSLVAEVYENAGWLVEHRERQLVPFLHGHAGGLWVSAHSGLLDDYPSTRFPPRVDALFSDPRLEGQLSTAAVRLRLMLDRYRTLAEEGDAIIASIEGRLGG